MFGKDINNRSKFLVPCFFKELFSSFSDQKSMCSSLWSYPGCTSQSVARYQSGFAKNGKGVSIDATWVYLKIGYLRKNDGWLSPIFRPPHMSLIGD